MHLTLGHGYVVWSAMRRSAMQTCVIPLLTLLIALIAPTSLAETPAPLLRILLIEDASKAVIERLPDGIHTKINGRSYSGEVVLQKASPHTLSAINVVPIEEYVKGILSAELPRPWPIEALKAQAVAARTYAYFVYKKKRLDRSTSPYDLKATVEDQVYKGGTMSHHLTAKAVESTRGEILTYHGKPIKARYHSSCGGKTETSIRVWGEKDVSTSISDPHCTNSPYNRWKVLLTPQQISESLAAHKLTLGEIRSIQPEKFESGGRVAAVAIHGSRQTVSLTGNDLRRFLGFDRIKSTLFTISKTDAGYTFAGRGFGHGVGMCQWGARGMAEKGSTYREILGFYYPGTALERAY